MPRTTFPKSGGVVKRNSSEVSEFMRTVGKNVLHNASMPDETSKPKAKEQQYMFVDGDALEELQSKISTQAFEKLLDLCERNLVRPCTEFAADGTGRRVLLRAVSSHVDSLCAFLMQEQDPFFLRQLLSCMAPTYADATRDDRIVFFRMRSRTECAIKALGSKLGSMDYVELWELKLHDALTELMPQKLRTAPDSTARRDEEWVFAEKQMCELGALDKHSRRLDTKLTLRYIKHLWAMHQRQIIDAYILNSLLLDILQFAEPEQCDVHKACLEKLVVAALTGADSQLIAEVKDLLTCERHTSRRCPRGAQRAAATASDRAS